MKRLLSLLIALFCSMNLYGMDYRQQLESIEMQAVVVGEGGNRVYAFIDPLCPKSQNYFETIIESRRLQKMNTYYIFLYRMKKYRSDAVIEYIYDASDVKEMMKRVMIGGHEPELCTFTSSDAARSRKKAISSVADGFGAKERPYILFFKEGSGYCKVSEGSAPCLEKR